MTTLVPKNYRILVVDDEKNMRTILSQMVVSAGYECLVAANGEDAIHIMRDNPVDVVITDIVMPGMDGIALTREVRKDFESDVIAVTGYTKDYSYEQIIGHGAKDFITKPIRTNELIVRLKRVLKEREIRKERDRAEKALITSERQLRALAGRLKEVEEDLRREIARELHDRVGQNLSALNLNLTLMQTYLSTKRLKRTESILDDSIGLLTETTAHIRDVMAQLRPAGLDEFGLASAVHWYVNRFFKRTGPLVDIQDGDYLERLPLSVETELFRITQEALTNILKHAAANQVIVSIKVMGDRLRLSISDDGKGFNMTPGHSSSDCTGWGLISMRERANSINGKFKMISEPGNGTMVVVEVDRKEHTSDKKNGAQLV